MRIPGVSFLKIRSSNRVLRRPATVGPTRGLAPPITPSASLSESTADSHRLPTCVGCQLAPTADFRDCRLASAANLPASPSNSTSDSHRRQIQRPLPTDLRLAPPTNLPVCLPIDLRLAPSTDRPAQPSGRPAACAADRPSGPASWTGPRLAAALPDPSGHGPPTKPPACAFDPSSGPDLPPTLQLAPSFDLPALPFEPNLRLSIRSLHRRLRLVATKRLRLRSTLGCACRASLPDRRRVANLPALPSRWPPTCADCQPSGSALEANFPDSRQLLRSAGAAVRSTFDLRHRSKRPTLPLNPTSDVLRAHQF